MYGGIKMVLFSNEVKNMKELEEIVKDNDLVSKEYEVAVIVYAFDKENAISKEMVLSETGNTQLFRSLCAQRVIRRYRGNYYFDERAETDSFYRTRKVLVYAFSVAIIVVVVVFILAVLIIALTE